MSDLSPTSPHLRNDALASRISDAIATANPQSHLLVIKDILNEVLPYQSNANKKFGRFTPRQVAVLAVLNASLEPLTLFHIAPKTKYPQPSIGACVLDLVKLGLVTSVGTVVRPNQRGRRRHTYVISPLGADALRAEVA